VVDLAALSWMAWALDLVENLNDEASFGEENWMVISGDTLGDAGEQRMTTLGSWMAWRSLAR